MEVAIHGHRFPISESVRFLRLLNRSQELGSKGAVFGCRAGTPLMSFKLTIGRVAMAGVDLYTNEAIVAVHGKAGLADDRWLFHSLPRIASAGIQDSAVKGNTLNKRKLENLFLRLPPLPEQRGIARILDTADEAVRSICQLFAKLEQIKQGLLHDLLTCGINESGGIRESSVGSEEFRVSSIGRIPSSWSVGPLGSYAMLQRGFDITAVEQRPGNVPVISSSGVSSFHDRAMVKGPGVVIGRKGKLGDAYYVKADFWPHDTSLWVKQFKNIIPEFAAVLLKSMRLERFDAATSVPTLNRNFIHPITVAIPPIEEQERILSRLDAASSTIRYERDNLAKLRLVKQGIMEDLLTGRVRVGGLA